MSTHSIVIVVHLGKAGIYFFQTIDFTTFYPGHQLFYFTLRSDQSGYVNPFSQTYLRIRFQPLANFLVTLELNTFKTLMIELPKNL